MLCQGAQRTASWIWDTLRSARKHDSKVGEESLTDFLVLQLKKQSKGSYYIASFTRPMEKITGADWELWITGHSGKWLGLRVQAKVISLDSKRYAQLHYKRKDGSFQIDQLEADAKKHNAVPLYCLYSYWKSSEIGKLNWPCVTFKKNSRLFGASWMLTSEVQALKPTGQNDLKSVAESLRPFHCLFCCGGYSGNDLPSRAAAFLGFAASPTDESSFLADQPPIYVSQLLQRQPDDGHQFDLDDPRLYRVTVVQDYGEAQSSAAINTDFLR